MRKTAGAAILGVLTAGAAAWWIIAVILVPASIRKSISEDLSPYFPGGITFQCPREVGEGRYHMRNFRAASPQSRDPWLAATGVELTLTPDGKALGTIRLGRPELWLVDGPDFIPPGAFRIPPGKTVLPRVEAVDGIIMGTLPGGRGLRIPWAKNLRLVFDSGEGYNTHGVFDTPVGPFSVFGNINPVKRSHLRAKTDGLDFTAVADVMGEAGPLTLHDRGSGAFTFAFGGGEPPLLAGSMALGEVDLEGAGVKFTGARLLVRGAGGKGGKWNPYLQLQASSATWDKVKLERVELTMHPGGLRAATGRAVLWGGELKVKGGMNPTFWGRGTVKGADLTLMNPDLLGAGTPSSGVLSADFMLLGGRLEGDFHVEGAALWSVPFLSGIRGLVPGLRGRQEVIDEVKGRFVHHGVVTRLEKLELTGSGFQLALIRPGRIGPAGRIDLEFEIKMHTGQEGAGLPPLRKLVSALSKELWKPFAKFIQFRVWIRGTLDNPVHELRPPEVFGK
jgi:hypothetical protein